MRENSLLFCLIHFHSSPLLLPQGLNLLQGDPLLLPAVDFLQLLNNACGHLNQLYLVKFYRPFEVKHSAVFYFLFTFGRHLVENPGVA